MSLHTAGDTAAMSLHIAGDDETMSAAKQVPDKSIQAMPTCEFDQLSS